ncbi:MAG TPA: dTMP kinase [Desulfosalsimonadaceae bacterium]|nr:dTMP kinase [Desulfosalsimonadaceae bacterium]
MFVTFEGIEGSGKTTQIRYAAEFLTAAGHQCLVTKEPGGTGLGRQIRAILLDPENRGIDPVTELLLYAADRNQHIQTLIRPALVEGQTVICDRFHDSTVVYQGYARSLDMGLIEDLHTRLLADLRPDMTFLLDLDPEVGLRRAWQQVSLGDRTDRETRFENEALSFHQKVRAGYLDLARREPARFIVVDAAQDEDAVKEVILKVLKKKLNEP